MAFSNEYFERNRDKINTKRRETYDSVQRKRMYALNRERILADLKKDRTICNLCHFHFRTSYLKKHLTTRHHLSEEEAICVVCKT